MGTHEHIIRGKLDLYFRDSTDNGYCPEYDEIRFSHLSQLSFNSVLDIGSGPCKLLTWLDDPTVVYKAVDIRTEVQQHCDCPFYSDISQVDGKYDLVALLGTVTFCLLDDKDEYKQTLSYLLGMAKALSNRYIVFTVMKENTGFDEVDVVVFSQQEIATILAGLQITNYTISAISPNDVQYMVICDLT